MFIENVFVKRLAISLVVYNNSEFDLSNLLDSIGRSGVGFSCFVVDNSERDGLRAFFGRYSFVEYHFVGKNLGYGAGHNYTMIKVINRFEFHLVVNPDIYFDAGVLEGLIRYLDDHGEVGRDRSDEKKYFLGFTDPVVCVASLQDGEGSPDGVYDVFSGWSFGRRSRWIHESVSHRSHYR